MRTKRKRKKLLKPKGSCRYAQCRQPALPDGNRCEKHLTTPQNFEKRKDSATIVTKEGDYEIMRSTVLGKATIAGVTLLAVLGLSAILVYEQKQIDTLKIKATPVKEVIITATPIVATVSAKPTITERASSFSITKIPTKGVIK